MRFVYHRYKELPKMSWLIDMSRYNSSISVHTGEHVENQPDFFVEGAWDGDFLTGDFDKAMFFCGSGAKIKDDELIVVTPCHAQEKLFSIRFENKLCFSNSLPFLLQYCACDLRKDYLLYENDLSSIMQGTKNYVRIIPLDNGYEATQYIYTNLVVTTDLNVTEIPKSEISGFASYDDYYQKLISTMAAIRNNANSEDRIKQFGITVPVSRGYDSTACAVIARKLGCSLALTFNKPRKYENDSGEIIANTIGYESIIMKNADMYLSKDSKVEALYTSSGELGSFIVFSAFDKEFEGNLVLFGERGDKIWDKNRPPNNEFSFPDEIFAGISHVEARLNIGYIYVPVPLFGATQWISIHEISNSDEMQRFSVGGTYDRPIPRRIAEESGIARENFGQNKVGAGINYHYDNFLTLKTRMSKLSYKSFLEYCKRNRFITPRSIFQLLKFYVDEKDIYLGQIYKKLGIKHKFKKHIPKYVSPGIPNYLIKWGIQESKKRYATVFF